jgi:LuxR family maltose regulon positive regulatory protein
VLEGQAELAYLRNQLDLAETLARDAIDRAERGGEVIKIGIPAMVTLARVQQARGDGREALKTIDRAIALSNAAWVKTWKVRLQLQQGDPAPARAWARTSGLSPEDPCETEQEHEQLMLARALIADGQIERAGVFLDRLRGHAESRSRRMRLIEIDLLRAIVLNQSGRTEEATTLVIETLEREIASGHVRIFIEEGVAIAPLLSRARGQIRRTGDLERESIALFIDDLLPLIPANGHGNGERNGTSVLIEPLTEREREVLALIASGQSNQQIANQLYVSLGTVKAHTNHLFAKLGVRGRTEAVARARSLDLLD